MPPGLYEGLEQAQQVPQSPPPPRAPAGLYEGLELATPPGTTGAPPREASGLVESVQAGLQGSAPGLMWRGRLPDLVMNPDTAKWWERAAASLTHIGAELPLMIGGAMLGAPAGAAAGGAAAGPGGAAAGAVVGAGFGMGVVPATIRTSLIEAYKSGEAKTPIDWFDAVRNVAKAALAEGGINAAAMGTGAVVGRVAGSALAPAVGQTIGARAAVAGIETADIATQIATMVTMPAAIEGRLPKAHEFLDAAIVIGGLKAAHVTAAKIMTTYEKTGKTPAEQVEDARNNAEIARDLVGPPEPPPDINVLRPLLVQRLEELKARLQGTPDTTHPGEDGKPVTVKGKPAEFLTDSEKAEFAFLTQNIDNPDALIARYRVIRPESEVPRGTDGRIAMPTIQEALFTDTARLSELQAAQRTAPLSEAERVEFENLKVRVADLEARKAAEGPQAPAEPARLIVTPEQATEAQRQRDARLAELEAKTEALTDQERAERVFLKNAAPEDLARRFGLGMAERRITAEEREASAQKVYDDVLQQLRDVDQARQQAGLQPLGDEHAQAVAALVRARVRTRAQRMGMLPEEIYRERPLQIRDETAAEVVAAEAEIPPGAPRFEAPETDLFGDPIAPQVTPRFAVENLATVEIPLKDLVLSKEVPQFKHAADEKGVIVPLGGTFDRTGVGPIQVWERRDGTLEVISGRHRLDLAIRSGEQTIPAQIHREAEGFGAREAATLDAQLNIREEQGSVADYAQYFKDSGISKEAAIERGLLARAKGKAGFAIARDGTPDLLAANRAGQLSDEAALSISAAAPGSERLQALGIAMVNEGKSILMAVNTMKAVDMMAAERMAKGAQGDIFGFDDSAMQEAAAMAKKASSEQRRISEQISAVNGASKRPELARKMGVDVQDPDGIRKRIMELKQEQELWDNWPLHPELVARLRGGANKPVTGREGELKQGPVDDTAAGFDLKPETPAELEARNREAAAQAMRKVEREMPTKNVTADQADLFNTQGTLFQSAPPGPAERWYSELTRQIDALPISRVPSEGLTAEQWKALLVEPESKRTVAIRDAKNKPTGKTKEIVSPSRVLLPGVKAEEIKWSGLEEWLDLQEGRVTKEQVRDFVASNGVRVTEKELGAGQADQYLAALDDLMRRASEAQAKADQMWAVIDREIPPISGVDRANLPWWGLEMADGHAESADKARAAGLNNAQIVMLLEYGQARRVANDLMEQRSLMVKPRAEQTKFSQYTLPGAKEGTYRELLLTLPVDKKTQLGMNANDIMLLDGAITARGYEQLNAAQIATLTIGGNDARVMLADFEARLGIPTSGYKLTTVSEARAFESSHFDEPNILAHVRFNERTDADGKRVLFVEEFQSDWAQKGKKEGFDKGGEKGVVFEQENGYWGVNWPDGTHSGGYAREVAEAMAARGMRKTNVPSAPFVGKTEAWVGLAMKRMIRYAAENGFDRIAWTRGEQQVERYTNALRKAVDTIEWAKTPEGVQLVGYKGTDKRNIKNTGDFTDTELSRLAKYIDPMAWSRRVNDGRAILWQIIDQWKQDQGLTDRDLLRVWKEEVPHGDRRTKVVDTTEREDALSDAIGKAMADKILQDPNQTGTIEGENIKIDDTGMAAFYDRIVPNVAKDVLKKLGGGKVAEIKIDVQGRPEAGRGLEEQRVYQGPEYSADGINSIRVERAHELPVAIERQLREIARAVRAGASTAEAVQEHGSINAAEVLGGKLVALDKVLANQPAFDITPAMRAKAMEGLPLFQKERGSYQIAERLITTLEGADKSTVVHELGHDWLEEMKADAMRPDAPAQIKADWDILRKELAIGEDGTIERASHEQFARSIERYVMEGEAPSVGLRGVFERFKTWLLDIYRSVMNLNVEINPELKAVLDRMLATDKEIADARELGVPRAYVAEAKVQEARKIVPGFKAEQVSMEPYADELPKGPGEAPDSSHINYAYINSPLDVKLTMQRMAEIDQANIQRQRGGTAGVKSWAESNAEQAKYVNDVLGGNEDTLKILAPRDPDAPGPDVRLGILKKLAVGAAKDSARLRDVVLQKGHDATVREQLEYMGSIERARMIQAEFLGERASVARALNALKDVTEGSGEIGRMLDAIGYGEAAAKTLFQEPRPSRTPAEEQAYLKAKLDEIMLNYGGRTPLDIARLHKEIGTLKGTFKFAKEVTKATKWEMVVEGWKASLLSGPVTHTTNLFGTGAFMALRAPVDAVAALIGMARGASPGMGETDRASMSEAIARITGMLGGVQDGLRAAKATFDLQDPTGKTEAYRNAIPGRAGELIRIPLRLMGAEDALVSTMYRRSELKTLAIRQAFDENLNPLTREFADRVTQLTDNPTPEMAAAAEAAATRMTFNMPLGEKGVYLQLFVNKWNLQWMIPFIRTPINITKEVARMSAFAPLVGEWRADMAKGGVARDKAIAEFVLGSGIMALTMAYAFAGNVTGGGGPDPGKNRGKAGVEQPYSIKVGDTWYEYARIQPTGTLMGMAADIAAAWDHMTPEEKDKVPRMLARAFANAVTNQTFLQGITNVVNAMSDPTRFAPKFLQQLAASAVPNVIGQPTAMADPVVREVNSAIDAIYARLPGFRETLLPKRDWLGEEVKTKERLGVVGPVRTMDVSKDPVRLEAARLDISMAAPPKKVHIGKGSGKLGDVELTPQEMDTFEQVGGKMAHDILSQVVTQPGYQQIPDMIKRRIFSRVMSASHKVAAIAALPPEKRTAYLDAISEKVAQQLVVEEQ